MPALNFKHLRYFWMVAKSGSIVRASELLHLSPQSISGQLAELESTLGIQLFRRVGRGLEMTEMGRHIYGYAEEIFALGNELMDVVQSQSTRKSIPFRIGIADSVPKTVAHRVIAPVMHIDSAIRLVCREGKLSTLLAEMAIHHLDMVIADRPMPSTLNIRAYSHLLGESPLCILGSEALVASLPASVFPHNLDQAPFLLPGEDVAIHARLLQWFESQHVYPRIVGEFDDSALMKLFGQTGAGLFVAPAAMRTYVQERYDVVEIGQIDSIREQLFAITAERRMSHPAVLAVAETTRKVYAA